MATEKIKMYDKVRTELILNDMNKHPGNWYTKPVEVPRNLGSGTDQGREWFATRDIDLLLPCDVLSHSGHLKKGQYITIHKNTNIGISTGSCGEYGTCTGIFK